ncbi:hypothetical protein GFM13_11485 [Rhizobium leguminosarum bv. viciae]|nr:hypothetical protein [Rhizobium leguminosarum bv. viciae]
MRRFVVRHNIDRFESQLASATDPQDRLFLQSLIDDARHEFAGLEQLWRISCPNLGISSGLGKEGEEILDHAVQTYQADFGTLQIWNDISSSLCLIAQTNFDNALIECFPETREGDDTVCASALKSKSMVSVSDLEVSDLFSSLAPWARTVGIRSVVASPVVG